MDEELIPLREVMKRTGRRRSAIYDDINKGRFPKPVRLGKRSSRWVASEVAEWINDRIRERDKQLQEKQ